ncbi:hypothetical protein [Methanococcus sp. CF]
MESKQLITMILKDILRNIDDYSRDLLTAENLDVEFKGFNLWDENGKRYSIKNLMDCDELPSFDATKRKYILRKVNLKYMDDGIMIIHLSSRKSDEYGFSLDNTFEVILKTFSTASYEHRERILLWNELTDEELDIKISEFDVKLESIVQKISENSNLSEVLVYIDVFMDLEKIENVMEHEDEKLVLWLHPVFLFSKESTLKGLAAYELSKYNKSLIEDRYRDILEYCKEYRELCGKNLKIIEKIREIAVKRNDSDILKEIDQMNTI